MRAVATHDLEQDRGEGLGRPFAIAAPRPEQEAVRGQLVGVKDRDLDQVRLAVGGRLGEDRAPATAGEGMKDGVHVVHLDADRQLEVVLVAQFLHLLARGESLAGQDQRHPREAPERDGGQGRQRVRLVDDEIEPRGEQGHRLERLVAVVGLFGHSFRLEREDEIEIVAAQPLEQLLGRGEDHLNPYFRIILAEPPQRGDQQRAHAVGHPDPQLARLDPFQVADDLLAVLGVVDRLGGVGKEGQSGLGGHDTLAHTVEERHVELVFQLLDLLRERALRDVQQAGRFREIPQLASRLEIFQLTQFHTYRYLSFLPIDLIEKMIFANIWIYLRSSYFCL